MNELSKQLSLEAWEQLDAICRREQQRIEELGKRSKLQAGLHNYIRFGYRKGKYSGSAGQMFVEIDRPFSWSDSAYTWQSDVDVTELTDEQWLHEFIPAIKQSLQAAFEGERYGGLFFDYTLELHLYIERELVQDKLEYKEVWINEPKLEKLKQAFNQFVNTKIDTSLPHYPPQQDLFFYSQLLLNHDVNPGSTSDRIALCQRTDEKLAAIPKLREEWERSLSLKLKLWAQEQFLPDYISDEDMYNLPLKPEQQRPQPDVQSLELFVYTALRVGKDEPDTRQRFLECAAKLGSQQAQQYVANGSGHIESERQTPHMHARANDILHIITIKLSGDAMDSYRDSLQYLCDLMQSGFPVEYTLKLTGSKLKQFVPVKGLVKSSLHRFFANSLEYPELYPLLEQYATTAMKEFAFYNDVEPGEKSVMPGTYVVLGLALRDRSYFPLLVRYMGLVDTEHQMAHNSFVNTFIETYPPTVEDVAVLLAILAGSGQSARTVKGLATYFEQPQLALELDRQLKLREPYEQEQLLYLIFGSASKQKQFLKRIEQQQEA